MEVTNKVKVTKQMIEDLFNIFAAILAAVAIVDPKAKTLTVKQLIVDVLAKTFDSLKTDIEQYFLQDDDTLSSIDPADLQAIIDKAKEIVAKAEESSADTLYEKIWSIALPILSFIEDTAQANLPKGSIAANVITTVIDAIEALGNQLKIDLPKLNAKS